MIALQNDAFFFLGAPIGKIKLFVPLKKKMVWTSAKCDNKII